MVTNYTPFAGAESYSFNDYINGQTDATFYDSLYYATRFPSVRTSTIMPYREKTPEALFSQWQAALGQDQRMVTVNEFYWTEYGAYGTLTFQAQPSALAVPAAGQPVTVSLDIWSMSKAGMFSKPVEGYTAYIKELGNQKVNITAVNKLANPSTVTLEPVNNEVLDLTQLGSYTILIDPLQHYTRGTNATMTNHGMVKAPPLLWKGYIQKFEDSIGIHEDEVDNYVYDRDFKICKGIDAKGNEIWHYYIPALNTELESRVVNNKLINTLVGVRDNTNEKGVDGLFPSAKKYGLWDVSYDLYSQTSLSQQLIGMTKTLRKTNGSDTYMLMHDFFFKQDWSDAIAASIKAADQSKVYEFFGGGGTGVRDFTYYEFGTFTAYGYKFMTYLMDSMDNRKYGGFLENTALMLPAAQFTDSNNNKVPILTYCMLDGGGEPAKLNYTWIDDARPRRERQLFGNVKTHFGIEIHGKSRLGVMQKAA